jgi:hypothetical protein
MAIMGNYDLKIFSGFDHFKGNYGSLDATQMSHSIMLHECLTRLRYANVSLDYVTRMSHSITLRKCLTRLRYANVSLDYVTRMSHSIMLHECLTRLRYANGSLDSDLTVQIRRIALPHSSNTLSVSATIRLRRFSIRLHNAHHVCRILELKTKVKQIIMD